MWLDDLVKHAASCLDDRAREALYGRGVSDEQIELYQLGYLNQELPELPYPEAFLKWSHRGKKLSDVFVLPLTNTLGNLKGLQFRHVEREQSGYMDFIPDKSEAVLFGLGQAMPYAWKHGSIFLVEGAFDLFPIQRHFPGTVSCMTAKVPEPFLRVLRRLVHQVWIGYDNDDTGRREADRFRVEHGSEFENVGIINYPRVALIGGKTTKDPSDLWEAWGDPKFGGFLRRAMTSDLGTETFDAQTVRLR